MAEALPPISFVSDDNGDYVVKVDGTDIKSTSALLARLPGLKDPVYTAFLAEAVNHLKAGYDAEIITDPAAFKASYLKRYEAENPEAQFEQGTQQLHNFDLPDFDKISAPIIAGDTLVFFSEDVFLGTPYRYEMPVDLTSDSQVVVAPF